MPSPSHEALVMLFRNRPALAAELLRDGFGLSVPEYSPAQLSSETMRHVAPVEVRADAVVVFEREGRPELATIVEVQLQPDEEKRRAWPAYVVLLQRDLRCPCVLLVIALEDSVARWSRRPINLGHPGFILKPLVVGRDAVPRVTDNAAAAEHVELAVLSAVAHGREPDAISVAGPVVHALVGLAAVDAERSGVYLDLVLGALSAAAKTALEAVMSSRYEYQSDFMKRLEARGLAEGRAKGEAEGRAKGEAEGRAKGRAEGERAALLRVLATRGLTVDAEAQRRIEGCTDPATLELWIARAVTAATLADVFRDAT